MNHPLAGVRSTQDGQSHADNANEYERLAHIGVFTAVGSKWLIAARRTPHGVMGAVLRPLQPAASIRWPGAQKTPT